MGRLGDGLRKARVSAWVARIRADWTHKVTTAIAKNNAVVVIEDLNVAGMVKNRKLARAISDIGMSEFRRQLTYKAALYGSTLVVADRWYPSSKTCSVCGAVKTKLSLSERAYHCEECGASLNRDINAAMNLRRLGYSQSPGQPEKACGLASARGSRLKQEPQRKCHHGG